MNVRAESPERPGCTLHIQVCVIHRLRGVQTALQQILPGGHDGLTRCPAHQLRRLAAQHAFERRITSIAGDQAVGKPVQGVNQGLVVDRAARPEVEPLG